MSGGGVGSPWRAAGRLTCDVCCAREAVCVCLQDDAALCAACDEEVHGCNALAARHARAPLPRAAGGGEDDERGRRPSSTGALHDLREEVGGCEGHSGPAADAGGDAHQQGGGQQQLQRDPGSRPEGAQEEREEQPLARRRADEGGGRELPLGTLARVSSRSSIAGICEARDDGARAAGGAEDGELESDAPSHTPGPAARPRSPAWVCARAGASCTACGAAAAFLFDRGGKSLPACGVCVMSEVRRGADRLLGCCPHFERALVASRVRRWPSSAAGQPHSQLENNNDSQSLCGVAQLEEVTPEALTRKRAAAPSSTSPAVGHAFGRAAARRRLV